MKSPMKTLLLISMLGLGMAQAQAAERIVVLSSDIADIMVALKAESLVVGRDSLSKAPSLAHAKNIGMFRNLSAEPIVALKPTVVLGSHMAHPQHLRPIKPPQNQSRECDSQPKRTIIRQRHRGSGKIRG